MNRRWLAVLAAIALGYLIHRYERRYEKYTPEGPP